MAGNRGNIEAMDDLRRILDSRAAFYSKADMVFDTSEMSPDAATAGLRKQLHEVLGKPA
jgi:XRE family aerobic/anaerobic benzoate catabolism transcriptional regulator